MENLGNAFNLKSKMIKIILTLLVGITHELS